MVRGTKVSIKLILDSNIVIILTIFLAKAPNISTKLITQDSISLHKITFFQWSFSNLSERVVKQTTVWVAT